MRVQFSVISLLLALSLVIVRDAIADADQYVVGVAYMHGEERRIPELEALVGEAYRRVGMSVVFKYSPPMRDISLANDGEIDASAVRTKHAVAKYENLLVVPEPLLRSLYTMFFVNDKFSEYNIDDFKSLRVACVRGEIISASILESFGMNPVFVPGLEHGIKMLQSGRADAVFTSESVVKGFFKDESSSGMRKGRYGVVVKSYHVVNVRHKDLVVPLAAAFREMIRDGTARQLLGSFSDFIPSSYERDH
ncbi:substrate-binding periplasmic protein [Nitratidesulfovibrio sp. SRB-5]|uniref:substrate-binding periplasmic protein n=1 Tax=Nitratidesulfovibrio sp. SRB-5 TaxID=2872636 RepID=UPI0010280DD0|nr:transporter substrate-binding domain-containing protein [Nitratidesulfovibrio sp. SRB-5]MBZ2171443.1 transporter substrate-binding domain-containing protein [Nitratidesulfovibrio sp. SRB-5]RXF78356.1 transporter substrate-binding domain-containing protein [Desulfovibrio sp. DS-1]